jgi:hypothetical protein
MISVVRHKGYFWVFNGFGKNVPVYCVTFAFGFEENTQSF